MIFWVNFNKLAHDRGQKRMAILLHMGFNRPGGASGHPDMVDTEFRWLEGGQNEEWPMQGRGYQRHSFLLFGWHNQCVLGREPPCNSSRFVKRTYSANLLDEHDERFGQPARDISSRLAEYL